MQRKVSKSLFKAKALELLRQVENTGESILITDRGKPTVEVRKYYHQVRTPLKILKGSVIEFVGPTETVAESDWDV